MLIEREIESKVISNIKASLEGYDCFVTGSWNPVEEGEVKSEDNSGIVIDTFIQPRQHDSFSLPTINLVGSVAMDFRVEKFPTMKEVSEVYEVIMDMFDSWHSDGQGFSEEFSTDKFFAAEIVLNGGDRVSFDRGNNSWSVGITFTIRGTVQATI